MNKKSFVFVSALVLAASTVAGAALSHSTDLVLGSSGQQVWNHYSGVAASFSNNGIKEYWVSCTDPSHPVVFSAPTGAEVVINDQGTPSAEFINALPTNDARLLKQWQKSYSFEDGVVPGIFTETKGNTVSITSSTSTQGSKALQIELTGSHTSLSFNRTWLEGIFNFEGANELYIDVKADAPAKDLYYNSLTNQWGVGRYEDSADASSGVRTHWKTITFTKANFADLKADNVVFRIDNSTAGNKIYIDNIRYGSTSVISSFERNFVTGPDSGNNYFVKDARDVTNEALINVANATVEISDKYASHGAASLHVKSTEATQFNFYIPYSHYASLEGSGLLFDVFIPSCDTMHVYPVDGIYPRNYFNEGNHGKWTTHFLPFSTIQTVGTNWVRFMGNRTNNSFDFYIDNIRVATNYEVGFENTVSYNAFSPFINFDNRNSVSLSTAQVRTGATSVAVTTSEDWTMLFKLSNQLYDLIPADGGIKFYLWCDTAFNGNAIDMSIHYWGPTSTWKEYIIPKANLDTTADRHYVCTAGVTGTIYIDDVSIVSALPASETYNPNTLTLPVDDLWY